MFFLKTFLLIIISIALFILKSATTSITNSALILFLVIALSLAMWAPGIAFSMVFRKFFTRQTIAAAIPLGVGLSGYLIFICWFFYPLLGAVVSGLIVFLSFTIILFDTHYEWKLIKIPFIIALTLSLLYVSIVGDHGGLNDANNLIAHRYWVSIDNKIPMFFSDKLILGKEHLKGFLLGIGTQVIDPRFRRES